MKRILLALFCCIPLLGFGWEQIDMNNYKRHVFEPNVLYQREGVERRYMLEAHSSLGSILLKFRITHVAYTQMTTISIWTIMKEKPSCDNLYVKLYDKDWKEIGIFLVYANRIISSSINAYAMEKAAYFEFAYDF